MTSAGPADDAKTLTIGIPDMECAHCEHAVERAIRGIPSVVDAVASYPRKAATIRYVGELDVAAVGRALKDTGYTLSDSSRSPALRDTMQIAAVFAALIAVALVVGRLGLVPTGLAVSDNTGFGLAFLIGLAASVTSCMAVTGGLLVALAAKYNQANLELSPWRRFKPHLAFNAGRLISYALLGGAIGALGSALTLSPEMTSALIVLASAVMIVLGLQMLRLLPAFGAMRLVPKRITHRFHDFAERNSSGGAFVLGALTFFLPCGFTQALQLYVLAKGSFVIGAVTMLAFALGTLPALLSLSALSSFARGAVRKHFLRIAGAAVILLGLLNIQYGLVLAGSNLGPGESQPGAVTAVVKDGKQVVEMKIVDFGYLPHQFTVQQGIPVEWRIDAKDAVGCGLILLSRSLGIRKFLSDTEVNVISFTPQAPGRYAFNCGMGMMTPDSYFNVVPSTKG